MKFKLGIITVLSFFVIFGLSSCNKDTETGKADVDLQLTDAPGQYDHVYIDIQNIEFHTDVNGWESPANVYSGVYDLLELNNGLDTLLCSVELPEGNLSQIRLILGNNNSLVMDSMTYSLSTPSAQQSGLKINLHQQLMADESYKIWLDFDAGKSIVEKGNGEYSLKPVIRSYTSLTNGKIKGVVEPMAAQPTVYSIQSGDTLTAIPNSDGFFMFCGLNGSYDIVVSSSNQLFQDTTLLNVQTSFGSVTDLDTISLN